MSAKTRPPSPFSAGTRFALVVDDVPLMRQVLADLLTEAGYLVITADDGDTALDTAPLFPFSVIVTDLEMPRMHGLEALRRIRRLGGHLAEVPVVVISGAAHVPDQDQLADAGVDAFISKGTGSRQVLQTIERLTGMVDARNNWRKDSWSKQADAL